MSSFVGTFFNIVLHLRTAFGQSAIKGGFDLKFAVRGTFKIISKETLDTGISPLKVR